LCAAPAPNASTMLPDDSFVLDGAEEDDETDDEWYADYLLDSEDAVPTAAASTATAAPSTASPAPAASETALPAADAAKSPIFSYYRKAHTTLPPARVKTPALHSPLETLAGRGFAPATAMYASSSSSNLASFGAPPGSSPPMTSMFSAPQSVPMPSAMDVVSGTREGAAPLPLQAFTQEAMSPGLAAVSPEVHLRRHRSR